MHIYAYIISFSNDLLILSKHAYVNKLIICFSRLFYATHIKLIDLKKIQKGKDLNFILKKQIQQF